MKPAERPVYEIDAAPQMRPHGLPPALILGGGLWGLIVFLVDRALYFGAGVALAWVATEFLVRP